MFKVKIIIVITAVMILISCNDNPVEPSARDLVGTWHWTHSVGGNLGYQDPDVCECSNRYEFLSDGTFEYFFNDIAIDSDVYEVRNEYNEFFGRITTNLYLQGESRIVFELIDGQMIFLTDWLCRACPDTVFYLKDVPIVPE
jgi:hypothetical protein